MSGENGPDPIGIATALGLASALRTAFAARLRLARRHAENRLRLAVIGLLLGFIGAALIGLALVFGLQAAALGLQTAGLTPTMAFLATAGGALLAALVFLLVARICLRRALHGPNP